MIFCKVLSKECKLKNGLEKFNVELYKNNLNEELIDSEDFRRKNEGLFFKY